MFICELFEQQESDKHVMHIWQENGFKNYYGAQTFSAN